MKKKKVEEFHSRADNKMNTEETLTLKIGSYKSPSLSIAGLKKKHWSEMKGSITNNKQIKEFKRRGYNQAIQDVLSIIKELV